MTRGRRPLAALLTCALLAGCAGSRPAGVLTRGGGVRKLKIMGLLYPQLAAGAVEVKGPWPGGRAFNGGEIAAVVHAAMRDELSRRSRPAWRDLAEDDPIRPRVALLTTSILREYSLNGTIPARLTGELARVAHVEAVLLVLITKFGTSRHRWALRTVAGDMKPAGGEIEGGWVNCGVTCAVVRTPGGDIIWEGGGLESAPVAERSTEAVGLACVKRLVAAMP